MLIGVNVTSAASFRQAQEFRNDGLVDFYEIMVDNFLHLDPEAVARQLDGQPVSFHIMSSRFLHREPADLDALAKRIRLWIDELEPLYVSDHLAIHESNGQLLPELVEVDYTDRSMLGPVERWQELLGCRLLLENFPSGSAEGAGQIEFFEELQQRLGVLPLFDLSNAVIGQHNGGARAQDWLESGLQLSACHISGYRPAEIDGSFLLDSHDRPVSAESWMLLSEAHGGGRSPATLVLERDGPTDPAEWATDLRRARVP
jgi:uncharacterized protein (UPF0276 family)